MHLDVVLTAGYSVVLLLVAAGLDLLARHMHKRSERYRTAGFRYDASHDHWTCPQDQMLWPQAFDPELRLVRYRAKASVCLACAVKDGCTSGDGGREVVRPVDPWPHSEAGRFHRGIALLLVALATSLVLVMALIHHRPAELALLAVQLVTCAAVGWWLTAHLRHTPANFPVPATRSRR
jgi:hypothetical protein